MRGAVKGRLGDRGAYLVAFGVCVCVNICVCTGEQEIWRVLLGQISQGEIKTTLTGQRLSRRLN